jgi:hypothetical protein
LYGVLTKSVPSTRIGVASNAMWAYAGAPPVSPVRYVQETCSRATLARSIWASAEYRVPPGSLP